MDVDEEISTSTFESFLEEDSTFVEFFNSFLALTMFPIRLHYNPDTGCFEEFKHKLADDIMDDIARRAVSSKRFSHFKSTVDTKGFKIGYYVKFLEKEEGIDWVKKNRLPLFLRSEICAEYKLARLLSNAQTLYLMNILIDSNDVNRTAFGENAAPKYRTNRHRGALPGLAEFQQQILAEKEESSSVTISDMSDAEVVEFSEIDHGKLSDNKEHSLDISLHLSEDGKATVEGADTGLEHLDATGRTDNQDDKIPSHDVRLASAKSRIDVEDEASTGMKLLETFDGDMAGNSIHQVEDEDIPWNKRNEDDYNILTVTGTLKGRLKDAQKLSAAEHNSEEKWREEKVDSSSVESRPGKLDTVAKVLKAEETNRTPMPDSEVAVCEERDINYNEIMDEKSTKEDTEINGLEGSVTKELSDRLELDNKKQCWTGEVMKCKSRGSSGLLRHTSIDSRPSSTIEHPPKGNGCIERKFLRKRHSMPHNNRIVLGDFQLHIGDEENWHAHVSRRLSMPATRPVPSKRKESVGSRGSIGSVAMQELTRILLTKKKDPKLHERLQSFYQDTEYGDDSDSSEDCQETVRPIDIASKMGMDAFKLFLIDTPGEKLFLLWIEIEKLKSCENAEERQSLVQEIRKRFFRSGAAHEVHMETVRRWNVSSVATIGYDTLLDIQDKIEAPLEQYWCARFTFHQKRKDKYVGCNYVSNDHHCTKSRCSTHQRELTQVPQRPNTSFPNIRTKQKVEAQSVGHGGKESNVPQISRGKDGESRTRAKIRSKSAHPRLINTSNIKDVNLSYKQLQVGKWMGEFLDKRPEQLIPPSFGKDVELKVPCLDAACRIITTIDEGCGFKALPYCRYKNDASKYEDKANVRLFIQPLPPSDCSATTVERSHTNLPAANETVESELIDSVVDCLLHEKDSGSFFYQHLQQKQSQLALDCYNFWKALQDYNEHFFSENFNPSVIKQKAGFIFTTYIINGSQHNINCPSVIQDEIHRALDPPYEDLFDKAEGHAMQILSSEYGRIFSEESEKYQEIKKNEKIKYLDVRSTLRRPKYGTNENMRSEESEDEDDEDPREKISLEEVNLPLPSATDGITFETFIRNKHDLESFKEFLERTNNKGLRDLLAWTEMENFRRSTRRNDQRNILAKSVRSNWLTSDYFFGPSSPATKEAQAEVRRLVDEPDIPERPPSPIIFEAQKYVRARIERRWFLMFKDTQGYQSKLKESNINEMVEDMIMKRRLQRSEAAWKILNSRWVSGSRDVIALRQTLMDPVKCDRFRKFLSLKGDLMDHNVYFWFEVQKYKDLCHRHVENSLIKAKVQAIIDVFIKSSVPPELQIDVPIEIAERLHEKATGRVPQLGPYLFREAQTTVFRIMFNHWKEFLSFHSSIEESKLSQHLEELHKKHKAEIRAKRMVADRRRLAKVAYEKRKKEKEEKERVKEKPKVDATSTHGHDKTISLISDDEEIAYQTKSFSYSKFTIEQQLQKLEQRMRDEGYTVEDFTEGDFIHSCLNASSEKKSSKKITLMDDQKSFSGMSFRTHRRRNESVLRAHKHESLLREPIAEFLGHNLEEQIGERRGSSFGPASRRMSAFDSISRAGTWISKRDHSAKKLEQDTAAKGKNEHLKVSALDRRKNLMPGPQRRGTVLTVQSLQEFEKSQQGKPLVSPLPLVRITSIADKSTKVSKKVKSEASASTTKIPHGEFTPKSLSSRKKLTRNDKSHLQKIVVT